MSKPKLKLIPLPKGLPKLPKGAVYLGFNIPRLFDAFEGYSINPKFDNDWVNYLYVYGGEEAHYAAPANSAIAKKILGTVTPAKKATKTVTKSRKTVTKSAKAKKTVTKDAPSRTYRDALNELPEPYRSQAIENIENMREPGYLDRETSLGGRVILGHAFCWANAPQGHDYWEAVHEDRTPPCETPKYRYFKDDNGVRWRMPVNGSLGETMVPGKTIWESVLSALQDIEYDIEDGSNGTIETDEHGNPMNSPDESEPETQEEILPTDPYAVTIGGVLADPYRIARAYGITDPVIFQALKKLLRFGRKHKEAAADVREAITSLERWEAMNKEDES
jgi:hypothetical protein